MLTLDHSSFTANLSSLIDTLHRYHDAGIDPAFDSDLEELERQFAEYRLTRDHNEPEGEQTMEDTDNVDIDAIPTNADRAEWAKNALAVFTARTFSGDHPDKMDRNDLQDAIADLICDLMHYARQRGFDTGGIIQQACGHFESELLEEEHQP